MSIAILAKFDDLKQTYGYVATSVPLHLASVPILVI